MPATTLTALRSSRTLAIGTCVRILACPIIMGLLLGHDYTSGTVIFLIAAGTDWVDGRLARSWGVVTKLGSFLDTTADKLLVSTAMVALVAVHRASPWVALVIIAREFTILGLRAAVAAGGSQFETSMFGKWKATVQFVAIALAMLRPDVTFAGAYLDQWALAVAAVITAWSGIDYLIRSVDALKA
jgi:CDP-diacylglycerol---glycerol-3-phosphate 3-phosphatidyltransferase